MSDHPTPRFASALSTAGETSLAIEQAAERLRADLGGVRPDLLAVFVSHQHGGEIETLGPRLLESTGAGTLIGCTGESVIGAGREVEEGPGLSVWAASMPGASVRPFTCEARLRARSGRAGSGAGDAPSPEFSALPPVQRPGLASLLLLADPFSFPMDAFLKRLNDELPGVPAVGGMASGGMGPGQNLLFDGRGLRPGGALGVVIEGDVEVRTVVSQGCRPVGSPWVVTDSEASMIRKLGGRSAMDVLMETVRDLPPADRALFERAPFVGLAIDAKKSRFERGDFLVRGITGVSASDGAVAIGDVPRRGQTVQFLVRDAASASEDLAQLMDSQGGGALGSASAGSAGALLFSCNGRGSRMFDTPDHDVTAVRSGLAAEVPVAGFFAMGEVGPVGGRNFLHGFTASVAVFRPRPNSARAAQGGGA